MSAGVRPGWGVLLCSSSATNRKEINSRCPSFSEEYKDISQPIVGNLFGKRKELFEAFHLFVTLGRLYRNVIMAFLYPNSVGNRDQ